MLESSFQEPGTIKRFPDPLVAELQRFTTSLIEQGYADVTVRVKVKLVTSFGQWLKKSASFCHNVFVHVVGGTGQLC